MKEREGVIIFRTCGEILAGYFFPLAAIQGGEENVCIGIGVDFGVVETLGYWQGLGENLRTTDDEQLGLAGGAGELDTGV